MKPSTALGLLALGAGIVLVADILRNGVKTRVDASLARRSSMALLDTATGQTRNGDAIERAKRAYAGLSPAAIMDEYTERPSGLTAAEVAEYRKRRAL